MRYHLAARLRLVSILSGIGLMSGVARREKVSQVEAAILPIYLDLYAQIMWKQGAKGGGTGVLCAGFAA